MAMVELQVNTQDLRQTRIVHAPWPEPGPGEILVSIDKFALTANNISYAVTGASIGYWGFFPAEAPWGKVPVWGFADVVASNAPDVNIGTRLWGFFPMASHLIMQPHVTRSGNIIDTAPHRQALPALYNSYMPTTGESAVMTQFEDARCIFLPLFATSFIIHDYYLDNDFFGVDTIIIGSASSKTGFGVAGMLKLHAGPKPRVIGLTSAPNVAFVEALGYFDEVATYDAIESLPLSPAVSYIDMAGSQPITARVHHHYGDAMKVSTWVGATHWEDARTRDELPGAQPQFFFAPAQFGKRTADWGEGEPMRRATAASLKLVMALSDKITVRHAHGPAAAAAAYLAMLEGKTPPDQGIMLSLHNVA